MLYTGANGYHFGNAIDMVEALEACPPDKLVLGNIDPVNVMKSQAADKVKGCVATLLKKTERFPNFILSTGCDTPPHVPMENIHAFFDALEEYNSEREPILLLSSKA
ncbi:MAG: uroporphyrinogen decarboxylase family protein [Cyclobacteriaceae bacterium]|nr:uroporphyrinogen decarboxylase family protein [Cyclobacteriaceae bacterium]